MMRRYVPGKSGKHVTTFGRRKPSPKNNNNNNNNNSPSPFQRAMRRARARARLRNAIAKVLFEIQYRPPRGSKFREAEMSFYRMAKKQNVV